MQKQRPNGWTVTALALAMLAGLGCESMAQDGGGSSAGEAAPAFQATLAGRVATAHCATLDAAVSSAAHDAAASSANEPVVLLAPACASFDQFRSFETRGDCFRDLVAALPGAKVRERPSL